MTEEDTKKYPIKPLTNDCDYGLWKIRVNAALDALGLTEVTRTDLPSETSGATSSGLDVTTDDHDAKRRKACAIIIRALSDSALRVVREVIDDPVQMMTKLDARYDNKSTAAKISKMAELVSVKYSNPAKDIRKHIDKLAGLVAQLKAMKTAIDDTIAVGILLASIQVPALAATIAAVKTLADTDMTWDTVATRLIEEWRDAPRDLFLESSLMANVRCSYCGKHGHRSRNCRRRKAEKSKKRHNGKRGADESSDESSAEGESVHNRAA